MAEVPLQYSQWTQRLRRRFDTAPRVLIVDDYATGAEALSEALILEGYEVKFVLSGVECVHTIGEWMPDIVFLDINMPEYDGFRTAKVIRGISRARDVLIVAFTALSPNNVVDKAKAVGIDAYCQKGISLDRLISIVEHSFES